MIQDNLPICDQVFKEDEKVSNTTIGAATDHDATGVNNKTGNVIF